MNDEPILRKAYYSIGEVCDLTGLKPHVLRYWETQFEALHPTKNRAGNRVYRPREVELVLLVKHLLYEKKFTIDGARQKLRELRKEGELNEERQEVAGPELFQVMKDELLRLQDLLTLPEPREPRVPPSAAPPAPRPRPADSPSPDAPGQDSPDQDATAGPSDAAAAPPTGGAGRNPAASPPSPPSPASSPSASSREDPYPQLQLEVDDG
jgi:DNA-binding transcriptional MerR regulator